MDIIQSNNDNLLQAQESASPYAVNVSAGSMNSTVSNQWMNRPADETFNSLDSLKAFCNGRAAVSSDAILDTRMGRGGFQVLADRPEGSTMGDIILEHDRGQIKPTHWSFGQLSGLAGAPAGYLRDLPADIAADALQWGLQYNRQKDQVKILETNDGNLRAVTGPDYGRIWHGEIVDAISDLNDRTGNRFKIPGMLDWSSRNDNGTTMYNPEAKGDSTLFCSDRDMFGFLCDDRNPIEIGKLSDGSPDLVFKGFYFWNSEEGSRTAGVAAFYLRGVCQNRCLWGVENFQEIKIRHTKFAPDRFAEEARPALESFCEGSTHDFLSGVEAARSAKVATDEAEAIEWLNRRAGLSRKQAVKAVARHELEEGYKPSNVWDMQNAITAVARDISHQDSRIDLERKAGAVLDQVA